MDVVATNVGAMRDYGTTVTGGNTGTGGFTRIYPRCGRNSSTLLRTQLRRSGGQIRNAWNTRNQSCGCLRVEGTRCAYQCWSDSARPGGCPTRSS